MTPEENLNNLTAVCRSNNVETNSSTRILISNLAWYTGIIQVDSTASTVAFELYDNTYTRIWNTTITTNIPNTVGRETGWGVIATQNNTDAAADIIQMDYMKLEIMDRSQIIRQVYNNNATIKLSQEFLTGSASVLDPFLGTAVSSGVINAYNGEQYHPGVVAFNDSTTAGGGYRVMTDTTYSALYGDETANFVFKHDSDTRKTSRYLMGWFDNTVISTEPTDGCYFIVWNTSSTLNNKTIRGRCKSNSVETETTTMYNISLNSWYWGRIQTNPTATVVNFSLFNATNNELLWNNTITSNIPNVAGRETGFGVFAGETTTDASKIIIYMDYMDLIINRTLYGR
jgi:hypothetical protein